MSTICSFNAVLFPAAPENLCACTPGGVLGGCGGVTLHADFADSRNKFETRQSGREAAVIALPLRL